MAINLQEIATAQQRAVTKAFTDAIQSVKDQAVMTEIAALLDRGDIEGVVSLLQLDPATFRPLENATLAAYEVGGTTGASQVGRIPVAAGTLVARFNVRLPRAESWIRTLSSQRIVEIAEESKTVIRSVLRSALAQGQSPRTTALDLVGRIDPLTRRRTGGFIGLTESQAQWVVNARTELETLDPNYLTRELRDRRLDGAFKKAIRDQVPLKARQIDTAITRLQARTLRYRGESIGLTESVNALRAGQNESIMQALEIGEIEQEFATKTWQDTGDGKTRIAHSIADGQTVKINQPFIVGGEALDYPGDPAGSAGMIIRCRCRSIYKMDFVGQASKKIQGFS
jgi:hypothetical protein